MTGAMFAGAGPEETERRIEQWAADVAAKADRYQAMQQRISRVSATERSADGAVRVTVDSSGVLTDLVFSDRATQRRPQQLAAQILDVMRRAQSRLTGQVQHVMRNTVGDDEATMRAVVASYERRFPEPHEPLEAPKPAKSSERADEHDDDWGGPILRP